MPSPHNSHCIRGNVRKAATLFALGACMTLSSAQAEKETAQQQFQRVSDAYFDQVYFPNQPTSGTVTGYHQYDTKLENYSAASISAEVAALKEFEKRVAQIPPASLDQTTRGDRQMVLNNIHSR